MAQFWWVIYPYLCLMIMLVGSLYRFNNNSLSWGSQSSEMLEKRMLRWGSQMFHWGIIFVLVGHVMGLLIPLWVYDALGITPEFYHFNAILFGGIVGVIALIGNIILFLRRVVSSRVRANAHVADYVSLITLFLVIATGISITLIYDEFVNRYEYRATVGPWFRQLFMFHPDASLMTQIPLIFQIHIILSFFLFAISPFTRLVHIWSYPFRYIGRPPIQYRSRIRYRRNSK